MNLVASDIARLLREAPDSDDPLVITPSPDLDELADSGAASVDLRLGTWFLSSRSRATSLLDIYAGADKLALETRITKRAYIPFGKRYIIHPGNFVLGVTLEWVRLPAHLSGSVVGKSSWGRRGLVIATATGVHPFFSGCLTLELANLGEVPIAIYPGMYICQLVLTRMTNPAINPDKSDFVGFCRPTLGNLEPDAVAQSLSRKR